MTIKDVADLFAAKGEEAKSVVENLKNEAKDALSLTISEAPPKNDTLGQYRYFKEEELPLLLRLEDPEERRAALHDIAREQDLRVRNLQRALTAAEERAEKMIAETSQDNDPALEETEVPQPGSQRHEHAMELLRSQDILARAARDMGRLGHVGEPKAKKLLFVCAVSAKAGLPVQPAIHAESSAGKNHLADTVLSLLPPEMIMNRTAVSGKALFYTDEDLRGRVIYLQEVVGSEDADFAIRVLQSAQYIEYEVTEKTPDGSFQTVTYRKEGPVVVVQTTTAIRLFHENDTRVFPVYVDESPEQTKRIVEHAKLLATTGGPSPVELEVIYTVWHDAIRLLEPAEVIVPYATRIEVPIHRVRVRRDINRLLDVIRIVAWLNQHNRERDQEGRVLATEEDFRIAAELVADPLQRAWKSLTPAEQAVMEAIASLKEPLRNNGFTRNDLEVEGHDKRRIQDALKALTETGYLERDGKRGPRGYRYTVSRNPENSVLGVYLRPAGNEGEEDPEEAADDNDEEEEDEAERGSREIARNDVRAIESGVLQEEGAVARAREEDEKDLFEEDEPEEEEADYLEKLTDLGWYRAETTVTAEDMPEDYSVGEDPVARTLRHHTPIYYGPRSEEFLFCWPANPLIFSAEEFIERWDEEEPQDDGRPTPWPSTPQEASERLSWAIPVLQAESYRFWDPGFSTWYITELLSHPNDTEEVCSEAYLHAELWKNEETHEQLWALVALREGWRVPDQAIEEAAWRRVTTGPRAAEEVEPEAPPEEDAEFEF